MGRRLPRTSEGHGVSLGARAPTVSQVQTRSWGATLGVEVPMPMPRAVARLNKKYVNKVLVHLAGHGWFVELEHVGRRSGRTYRVPIMAFDRGDAVTVALTYGSGVDWLANLRSAGGGRMHARDELLCSGRRRACPRPRGTRGCRNRLGRCCRSSVVTSTSRSRCCPESPSPGGDRDSSTWELSRQCRCWQTGHQYRRRPAISFSCNVLAQRGHGWPVRL
ncbi:hypothetical protein GCM10009721_09800 [Terrabacter tumescens]|uniref:Nitroreductase family deazaflavin-dependent oxidoreductase n=1 Tax=Terrabacter tumescens TaxID=60443 RepID=A0ABQ2HR05_9MICO|nr:hypothetical protein GCM10009721_09800 [Terrabacter tumescens]